jgi:ribosomal protein S18 acetylase RimI-like enzyme
MTLVIRRLGPGDEAILELLARDEPDFDLDERATPLEQLTAIAARSYLGNPAVVHWIALDGDEIVGDLVCLLLPLRAGEGQELLLYEIGVRSARRRQGIGRALLDQMEDWMQATGVGLVWVVADNQAAVEFYRARGFVAEEPEAVYLARRIGGGGSGDSDDSSSRGGGSSSPRERAGDKLDAG